VRYLLTFSSPDLLSDVSLLSLSGSDEVVAMSCHSGTSVAPFVSVSSDSTLPGLADAKLEGEGLGPRSSTDSSRS
jgi:hypothetical protein